MCHFCSFILLDVCYMKWIESVFLTRVCCCLGFERRWSASPETRLYRCVRPSSKCPRPPALQTPPGAAWCPELAVCPRVGSSWIQKEGKGEALWVKIRPSESVNITVLLSVVKMTKVLSFYCTAFILNRYRSDQNTHFCLNEKRESYFLRLSFVHTCTQGIPTQSQR